MLRNGLALGAVLLAGVGVAAALRRRAKQRRPTDSEIGARFAADGFIVLRGFLSASELRLVTAELRHLIATKVDALPAGSKFYEDLADKSSLKQLQKMFEYSALLDALFRGRFQRVAEACLGGEVLPVNLQFFNKPSCRRVRAGSGGGGGGGGGALVVRSKPTPAHQDGAYFHLEPCLAVTGWCALDAADAENGCLRYCVGSHRDRGPGGGAIRPHTPSGVLGFSRHLTSYPEGTDAAREVAMTAAPGDLILHCAQMIHMAGMNRTTRERRALGFIYYAKRAQLDHAAEQRYQAKVAEQWRAEGKL